MAAKRSPTRASSPLIDWIAEFLDLIDPWVRQIRAKAREAHELAHKSAAAANDRALKLRLDMATPSDLILWDDKSGPGRQARRYMLDSLRAPMQDDGIEARMIELIERLFEPAAAASEEARLSELRLLTLQNKIRSSADIERLGTSFEAAESRLEQAELVNRIREQLIASVRTSYEIDPRAYWILFSFRVVAILDLPDGQRVRRLSQAQVGRVSSRAMGLTLEAVQQAVAVELQPLKERMAESQPKVGRIVVEVDESLTDVHRSLLRAMRDLGAIDYESRRPRETICPKAGRGNREGGAPGDAREALSDLVRRKYANAKTGRGGGYWLTPAGQQSAAKLS